MQHILSWVSKLDNITNIKTIIPLKGDASSRSFYRLITKQRSFIVLEDPDQQNLLKFIYTAELLIKHNISCPKIYHYRSDLALIEDLGSVHLIEHHELRVNYKHAVDAILQLQKIENSALNKFTGKAIYEQFTILNDYFFKNLATKYTGIINKANDFIVNSLESQKYATTHFDFHSKNIMIGSNNSLRVIDFQDLLMAPNTYDLCSLLDDVYIDLPINLKEELLDYFYNQLAPKYSFEQFMHNYQITSLQRHLKIIGVFIRLNNKYNKPSYLQYLPKLLELTYKACSMYNELSNYKEILIEASNNPSCRTWFKTEASF